MQHPLVAMITCALKKKKTFANRTEACSSFLWPLWPWHVIDGLTRDDIPHYWRQIDQVCHRADQSVSLSLCIFKLRPEYRDYEVCFWKGTRFFLFFFFIFCSPGRLCRHRFIGDKNDGQKKANATVWLSAPAPTVDTSYLSPKCVSTSFNRKIHLFQLSTKVELAFVLKCPGTQQLLEFQVLPW